MQFRHCLRFQRVVEKLKGTMLYSQNSHSPIILAAERETQVMRALEKVLNAREKHESFKSILKYID
jgi:hypothetical protein